MAGASEAAGVHTPAVPRTGYRWAVLFGLWLVYGAFGMTSVSLAPLVAPITRDLGIGHGSMGLVLGLWQAVYIVAAVPAGILLDRIGTRLGLLIGGLIVALSGLVRGLAPDQLVLMLAVALFGIGGPIISAGAPKVVSHWFSGRERGFAMGLYITGPAIGAIVTLALTNSLLMPAFADDWRRVLLVWAAIAFLLSASWLVISSLPAVRRNDPPADGRPGDGTQRRMLGDLLRLPAVRLLLVMSVGIFTFNHGLNNWLPELLRTKGMTPAAAGYWATLPTIAGIFGAILVPQYATRERRFAVLGAVCACALLATFLLHVREGWPLVLGLVLQGIARSCMMTVAMLALVEMPGIGEKHAGMAGGLFFSAAEVGGAGGPIVLGILYESTGGFGTGLVVLSGVCILLLVGVAMLDRMAKRAR